MKSRDMLISGAGVGLALLAMAIPLAGQIFQFRRVTEDGPARNDFAGVISLSEEAKTLLTRAQEGIEREDWKLAVDSLQRIIDLQGEHVLTSDESRYESARRYAHRLIAQLPAEGLAAYRLIHDGEATTLYRQARSDHDPRALRRVVERYLCTSVGDEASVLLADWLIDEGRFAEASGVLLNLRDLHPDPDISDPMLTLRLAVCAAGMGQRQRVEGLLSSLSSAMTRPAEDARPLEPAERERLIGRLEAIRAYAEREHESGRTRDVPDWRMAGGSLLRHYLCPEVEPAFVSHMPNEIQLPLPQLSHAGEVVLDYTDRRKLLPVRNVTTDGRVLVAKGLERLVAVDIGSFAKLWTTEPTLAQETAVVPSIRQQVIIGGHGRIEIDEGDAALDHDPLIWQLLYDSVGSSVCIAGSRVLTIDWIRGPARPLRVPQVGHGRGLSGGGFGLDTIPNQVVAYSVHDGSLLWRSDTRVEGAEQGTEVGFEEVEFLSVPVPVEGGLLAPARVNTDLYALLLNEKTGRLENWLYLCGTGDGAFDSLHALEPCVADGVAYIPTGRGLLFALDIEGWSVRWAVRYDGSEQVYQNQGWIPQPVVAVSDVVLLAPPDSNRLHCFARSSGVKRWDISRDQSRYILAATDKHLWLAGDTIRRISVETGKLLADASIPQLSGRGVISGRWIFLPTDQGILKLESESLERVSVERMVGGSPPGNLLAWGASLFNTDAFKVHRYVDVERGYAQALAKYKENSSEPSRAVALAWMQLHRSEPEEAMTTLSSVVAPESEEDELLYESVVQLRVRALLDWAASGTTEDDEAIALLRQAREISQTTEDVVRSILALGDYYERMDDPQSACREYAWLALSDHGDRMYSEEGESRLERLARLEAALRIADAQRLLLPGDQAELESYLRREYLESAMAARDRTVLRRLAETGSLGVVSSEAELVLGKWLAASSRFEQAEAHLRRVIDANPGDALVAEATGWLAAMYLIPRFELPVQAVALLDQLERRYAEIELPAAVTRLHEISADAADADVKEQGTLSGRQLASHLRERVDSEILARHRRALAPFTLGPPREPRVQTRLEGRPLSVRGPRVEAMAELVFMLVDEKEIEARDAGSYRVVWPAKLRLLGEMAVEPRSTTRMGTVSGLYPQFPVNLGRGVVDGQTLIVNSEFGLHAIGLLTGRRLWSRPYQPPSRSGFLPAGSDASLWAHRGYVMSVDSRGILEVAASDQGHRIQWRASMPMRRWQWVLSRGDYVVAVDAPLERLDVFRLADGRRLGECVFEQPTDTDQKISISVYDEVVCGPASGDEVVAYELARPGVERWRLRMPEGVGRILKPSSELLVVTDEWGSLKMVDPQSGNLQAEARIEKGRGGIFSAAVEKGVLYVAGFEELPDDRSQLDRQRWYVAALDTRSGRVIWMKDGFRGYARHMRSDLLTIAENVIPVVQFVPAGRDRQNELSGVVELVMLDRATGQTVGEERSKQISREANAQWILDVQVWADKIMVMTGSSVVMYPLEAKRPSQQSTRDRGEHVFLARGES